jgi:hypothetical protein
MTAARQLVLLVAFLAAAAVVVVDGQTCSWIGDKTYGYEQCSSSENGEDVYSVALVKSSQEAYTRDLGVLKERYRAECSDGSPTAQQCKAEKEEGFRLHAFDLSQSNRLPLSRAIPDIRPEACGGIKYGHFKSTMTVVLVFYNEGTSTLLRTAQSVLDRTPPGLLKEILLVDDGNPRSDPRVQKQLADIEAYRAEHPKVRLLELKDHMGLIVAKNRGAQAAQGDIVTFMDSHCEVGYGWAEPLVAAIEEDWKTVAVPLIDAIGWEFLDYLPGDLMRGIMTWSLYFTWQALSKEELVGLSARGGVGWGRPCVTAARPRLTPPTSTTSELPRHWQAAPLTSVHHAHTHTHARTPCTRRNLPTHTRTCSPTRTQHPRKAATPRTRLTWPSCLVGCSRSLASSSSTSTGTTTDS